MCAALAAATVAVAGFGVLTAFWALQPSPAHLPGLFDFASATWGDGVALPLMAGSLAYAIRLLPAARHDAVLAGVAGLLGAAIGVATQVSWLGADAPRLNWTLPRPHHFTAAGWYHAAFLVLMCAAAAALWVVALNRAARSPRLPARAGTALAMAFAAGVAFLGLLAADAHVLP